MVGDGVFVALGQRRGGQPGRCARIGCQRGNRVVFTPCGEQLFGVDVAGCGPRTCTADLQLARQLHRGLTGESLSRSDVVDERADRRVSAADGDAGTFEPFHFDLVGVDPAVAGDVECVG